MRMTVVVLQRTSRLVIDATTIDNNAFIFVCAMTDRIKDSLYLITPKSAAPYSRRFCFHLHQLDAVTSSAKTHLLSHSIFNQFQMEFQMYRTYLLNENATAEDIMHELNPVTSFRWSFPFSEGIRMYKKCLFDQNATTEDIIILYELIFVTSSRCFVKYQKELRKYKKYLFDENTTTEDIIYELIPVTSSGCFVHFQKEIRKYKKNLFDENATVEDITYELEPCDVIWVFGPFSGGNPEVQEVRTLQRRPSCTN